MQSSRAATDFFPLDIIYFQSMNYVNLCSFLWLIYCDGQKENQSSHVIIRNMSLELTLHLNFFHLLQLSFVFLG